VAEPTPVDQRTDPDLHTITRIVRYPERKRIEVNFNTGDVPLVILPVTFEYFRLYEGQCLSAKQIHAIRFHDQFEIARDLALRFLGRRMRSIREMERYLQRLNVAILTIQRVISYCLERHYLDDSEFARAFAREQVKRGQSGKYRIIKALCEHGIDPSLARTVAEESVSETTQLELAEKLACRKLALIGAKPGTKLKLLRYLTQKGFSREVISQTLTKVLRSDSRSADD